MAIAIALLKTLLELGREKKTGAVDAVTSAARVRIFVEDGAIVFAADGAVGETLGRILVRERVLSEEQYAAALEWTSDRRAVGKRTRLGEVLVDLRMLTPHQLEAALSAQVRQKVVRALAWAAPRIDFVSSPGPLELEARYPTPLEPLVLAALRVSDVARLDALFAQARGRFVSLPTGAERAEALERIGRFAMSPAELRFARSLDGSFTVAELLDAEAEEDRRVVLGALLLTDLLDLQARSGAGRTSAQVLAAARATSTLRAVQVRPPVAHVRRRSAPPPAAAVGESAPSRRRSSSRPPPSEKAQAQAVAVRLKSAREAKRALVPAPPEAPSPATPPTPHAPMERLLAERAFQTGKRLVRANKMSEAAEELRRAATLYPAPEYHLWATWAAMRSAPRQREARLADELRAAAAAALEQDPDQGFAHFALGHLALRDGDADRARELFEKARSFDHEAVEDVRDVRLRAAPAQASAETRGDLRALAPLLTAAQRTLEVPEGLRPEAPAAKAAPLAPPSDLPTRAQTSDLSTRAAPSPTPRASPR